MLPLACEYQIEKLKNKCIKELQKMVCPRLELVTLAHKLDLTELLNQAIEACVSQVHSGTLEEQLNKPENAGLPEHHHVQILK